MSTTYVALLHSIVLGGGRRLVMDDLRRLALSLRWSHPRTLAATGNLLFDSDTATGIPPLEAAFEAAYLQRFGKVVDVIIRPAAHWPAIVAGNPFRAEADRDPALVHLRVMRQPLGDDALERLRPYCTRGERVALAGGDLWIDFGPDTSGSKLLPALTTKRIGIGTLRNWNTVRRFGEMLPHGRS